MIGINIVEQVACVCADDYFKCYSMQCYIPDARGYVTCSFSSGRDMISSELQVFSDLQVNVTNLVLAFRTNISKCCINYFG